MGGDGKKDENRLYPEKNSYWNGQGHKRRSGERGNLTQKEGEGTGGKRTNSYDISA